MSTVPSPPPSSSSHNSSSRSRPLKSSSSASSVQSYHLPSRHIISASSSSGSIRSTHNPSHSTSSTILNPSNEASSSRPRARTISSSNGSEPDVLLPSVFSELGMDDEGYMISPASYVQAEYDYEPAETGSYLSFQRGEIIRIVNRDASGWWDGEIDGRRGWFPSNYVNPAGFANILPPAARQNSWQSSNSSSQSSAMSYGSFSSSRSSTGYTNRYELDSDPLSPSEAIGSAFTFISQTSSPSTLSSSLRTTSSSEGRSQRSRVRTNENRGHLRKISRIVKSMLGPISRGITLLEAAIAGNRVSHFGRSTACIIESVKDILEATGCRLKDTPVLLENPELDDERKHVLCRLNDLSKRAQRAGSDATSAEDSERESRKMLKSAYKLRERLERFLDVAVECGVELPSGSPRGEAGEDGNGQRDDRGLERTPTSASSRSFGKDGSSSANKRLQKAFRERNSTKLALICSGLDERIASSRNSPTGSMDSSSSSFASSPSSPASPSSLFIDEHGRIDVISSVRDSHEKLLSILAAFIGHIHSHSSNSHPSSHAHILDVTRACIDKVRDLLSVLEAVTMHKEIVEAKPVEVKRVESVGAALYQATVNLVSSAKIVAALPFTNEPSEQNENEQTNLLNGATRTLRNAQDCVQAIVQCVSRDGHQPPFVVFLSPSRSPEMGFSQSTPRSLKAIGRSISALSPLTRESSLLGHDEEELIEELASGDDELEESRFCADDEDLTVRAPEMYSRAEVEVEDRVLDSISSSTIAGDDSSRPGLADGRDDGLLSTSSSHRPLLFAERSMSSSTQASLALSTNSMTTESSSLRSSVDSTTNARFAPAVKVASFTDIPYHLDQNESTVNAIPPPIQKDLHRPQLRPRADSNPYARQTKVLDSNAPSLERSHTSLGVNRPAIHPRTMTSAEARVWVVGHSYHPSEIAYNSEGVMVGATLSVLIEKMTPHDTMVDPTHSATFFLTFRLFSTPLDVLDEVIRRFDLQPPNGLVLGIQEHALWQEQKVTPTRVRIFAFLRSWLDNNFQPVTDQVIIPHLIHFATQGSIRHALPSLADKLLDSIERHARPASLLPTPEKSLKKISSIERLRNVAVPPTPIMDKKLFNNLKNPSSIVSVTDFDATELARQISIMESKLYCAISPQELLECGKKSIKSIKAMSTFSNQITGFVSETILNEQDTKKRTALLKYFVKLATRLVDLQNFSGGVAVLAALNGSSVARLKKTWEGLSVKSKNSFQILRELFDVSRNHATYRARLRDTSPPALPFLGNILTDLTFLNDGNLATRPSPLNPENTQLINLSKYNAISRLVQEFQRFQVPFSLCEVPSIQSYLHRVLAEKGSGSLDGLYRKSLLIEPKLDSRKTLKL